MRQAKVFNHGVFCGYLRDLEHQQYQFEYDNSYHGSPISLTMPLSYKKYDYNVFPPFFDGLLPEGIMLESLLKRAKIDRHDYYSQLVLVGSDLVGSVTVEVME